MEDHHNRLKSWNQKCHMYVFCLLADLRRKQIILGQNFSFSFSWITCLRDQNRKLCFFPC